jgi:hypothetical protein
MAGTIGQIAGELATCSLALARRFAAGATLWAVAPEWPAHAHHIAVEFVHPVIVGKRALPAVAVEGHDPVGLLRCAARPGDVVVAVAGPAQPSVADLMRRAPAWGLTSVWIGAGARPPAGAADHVLWLDAAPAEAAHGGLFVLAYHLLWELTHVCFEHPGLLGAEPEGDEVCMTCADAGRLAEVVAVAGDGARVRTPAGVEHVDASLVGDLRAGDLVVVHAGTVISVVETEQAAR